MRRNAKISSQWTVARRQEIKKSKAQSTKMESLSGINSQKTDSNSELCSLNFELWLEAL